MNPAPAPVPEIVGRAEPLSRLAGMLDRATTGGSAILISGEPGAGKTTFTGAVARMATGAGFQVLTCTGVESETEVGLAGLHELLRVAINRAGELPPQHRDALLSVFGIGPPAAPDRLLLTLAVYGLLTHLADEQPLLLVVEDAHWMDEPTVNMIGFLAQRVTDTAIVMVVTRRPDDSEALGTLGLDEILIDRLTEPDARTLVRHRHPAIRDHVLRQVLNEADGNPLALVELSGEAMDRGHDEATDPPVQVPVRARLESGYVARFEALSPQTQDLLLLAAASSETSLPELTAAAKCLGLDMDALTDAEDDGLVVITATDVSFRHPLIRSAIYQRASLYRRIRVHRTLAQALSDNDPPRAAWHRAAATLGRDEAVARDLENAARIGTSRGNHAAAMRALEKAVHLTPAPGDQARRLALAAQAARLAGLPEATRRLSALAADTSADPETHGELAMIRIAADVTDGTRSSDPIDLLQQGLRTARDGHADIAVNLIAGAAVLGHSRGMPDGLQARIEQALAELPVPESDPRCVIARTVLAPTSHADTTGPLIRAFALDDANLSTWIISGLAIAAESLQDWPLAVRCWSAAAERYRASGALSDLFTVRARLSVALLAHDRLGEALREAEAVAHSATGMDLPSAVAFTAAVTAHVHAWQGRPATAPEPGSDRVDVDAVLAWSAGIVALTQGLLPQAYTALCATAGHPGTALLAIADLAEAAAGAGHAGDVRAALAGAARQAESLGSPLATMLVHRGYALLGENTDEHCLRALRVPDADLYPLQTARTRLVYGEWLRRNGRIPEARAELTAAATSFEQAGARPWLARTRIALSAAGAIPPAS
ncbi:hypothetical protein FB565_008805 [Actinoplanes lutulentus]|uniref:ATP-binding protein n=1 Tax=Actinoplanes lutulentus TaxID=1287878 RepID=UPI0015EB8678|nr:AAA family ATPase [Actinoplanes lutulentus]MBB2949019.1 hypothetical protein [Actinoplanes lutulentus]